MLTAVDVLVAVAVEALVPVVVAVVVAVGVVATWRGQKRPTHNETDLCLPFLMNHQHHQLTIDYYISANVNVEEMPFDYTH